MKVNVASWDRVLRVVLGVILIALSLAQVLTGALGIIAIVLGVVFIITAAVSFCPIYWVFKLSTKKS